MSQRIDSDRKFMVLEYVLFANSDSCKIVVNHAPVMRPDRSLFIKKDFALVQILHFRDDFGLVQSVKK